MNALAILYVNQHLQDILDDAAETRDPGEPAFRDKIGPGSAAWERPKNSSPRQIDNRRGRGCRQSTSHPTGAEASYLQLRPPPTTTPVPPTGVVVFCASTLPKD